MENNSYLYILPINEQSSSILDNWNKFNSQNDQIAMHLQNEKIAIYRFKCIGYFNLKIH